MIGSAIETVVTILILLIGSAAIGFAFSLSDVIASLKAKRELNELFKKTSRRPAMGNEQFEKLVKRLVAKYANEHMDKTDGKKITEDDVFIVWICKTLQNNKALASTTLFDGMYYELTYNGDKDELYFDAYKKWQNICVPSPATDN